MAGLIDDLDAPKYTARERTDGGPNRDDRRSRGRPPRLATTMSAEVRQRVRLILDSPRLREVRAVEFLETLGTPEALTLLDELSHSPEGSLLTRGQGRRRAVDAEDRRGAAIAGNGGPRWMTMTRCSPAHALGRRPGDVGHLGRRRPAAAGRTDAARPAAGAAAPRRRWRPTCPATRSPTGELTQMGSTRLRHFAATI